MSLSVRGNSLGFDELSWRNLNIVLDYLKRL